MGEAKRRKRQDPHYGQPQAYMSYLELPYTEVLVGRGELRELIQALQSWAVNHEFYATVVYDHTGRWQKIEKLCLFIGMEKLLDHNARLYNTRSVFVTKSFSSEDRSRLTNHYGAENKEGFSYPPPAISWSTAKETLMYSHQIYEDLSNAGDVNCIYQSSSCVAFHIPSDVPSLAGLHYVEFFTRLELLAK